MPAMSGQLPAGESAVLYRGRAAELLASRVATKAWEQCTECPWEDLRHPERVHVDPFGNLHICQGISIGNLLECPLAKIMSDYDPDDHPIIGPLLVGGEGGMDSNRLKAILTPAGRLRRLKCSGSHITV